MALTIEPECQAHIREVNVTEGEPGDTNGPGASFMGGKPRWYWMEMAEGHGEDAPKDCRPEKETAWRCTRPHGIDYKEDSSKPEIHDMLVRFGGKTSVMTESQGAWGEGCVDTEGG